MKLVSTSRKPLVDIPADAFSSTVKSKGVDFAVERKFDVAAMEKAAEVLQGLYRDAGQDVRVEHAVSAIPPHALEVSFEVIQQGLVAQAAEIIGRLRLARMVQ